MNRLAKQLLLVIRKGKISIIPSFFLFSFFSLFFFLFLPVTPIATAWPHAYGLVFNLWTRHSHPVVARAWERAQPWATDGAPPSPTLAPQHALRPAPPHAHLPIAPGSHASDGLVPPAPDGLAHRAAATSRPRGGDGVACPHGSVGAKTPIALRWAHGTWAKLIFPAPVLSLLSSQRVSCVSRQGAEPFSPVWLVEQRNGSWS